MKRASLVAGLALVAVAGCVSLKRTPEARFFVLRSRAEPVAPAPSAAQADPVGVLPVLVPGYLDRPQLVTWVAPGELRIDEFLRWAEPLDAGVSRTLAENLDALLPERRLVRWPWPASTPLRCRIRVEVQRFGPEAEGGLRLEGSWAVLPARGERPLTGAPFRFERGAPSSGADTRSPAAAVEAMSDLLLALAREIAAVVKGLPTNEPATAGEAKARP